MERFDPRSIRRKILRNHLCSEVFKTGEDIYLVGGYLRDLLIKGIHSKDIDFVVNKNVRPTAIALSESLGGRLVEMRKDRMFRVVLPNAGTLDFSPMDGDMQHDLGSRDFTINAVAWSPQSGLIDPHGGLRDMKKGVVRAISGKNLRSDPLRLLRAYRFAAELSMPISRTTRALIRPLADRISDAAAERITLEFFRLLSAKNPSIALKMALYDGLLDKIIPLPIKLLRTNIKSIAFIETNIQKLHERYYFNQFSQGLTLQGLLRLERLMIGADLRHSLLSVSSDIRKRIEITGRMFYIFKNINKLKHSDLYHLYSESEEASTDLLIMTGHLDRMQDIERFNRIQDKGLLSAEEIMTISGISSGPGLGSIIREIKRLQFEGALNKRAEARRWLLSV